MDWDSLFMKYVWNKQTTPYFTSVDKLNLRQANSEILVYSLFLAVFFGMVSVLTTLGVTGTKSFGVSFYGFTVVCAAVLFIIMKSYYAALFLSATPIISIAYIFFYGMGADRARVDTLIVTGILILLAIYSYRIVSIARNYHSYPDIEPDDS